MNRTHFFGLFSVVALLACQASAPQTRQDENDETTKQPEPSSTDAAPGGTVFTDGQPFDLADTWKDGPAVLVFYRAAWCGYCRKQLQGLQDNIDQLGGASLVGISAGAEDAVGIRDKTEVEFPLYADPDLSVIRAWDVEDVGHDIAKPATFVVNASGQIVYRHVGQSKSDRPDFDAIVEALANARAGG